MFFIHYASSKPIELTSMVYRLRCSLRLTAIGSVIFQNRLTQTEHRNELHNRNPLTNTFKAAKGNSYTIK